MPQNDTLTPQEAAYIAANAYFTLKDWVDGKPKAGVEDPGRIKDRVLGAGATSLRGTGLRGAELPTVLSGTTGLATSSGFGYVLNFTQGARRHAVVAARGTRPEMAGQPDLWTDLRAGMTHFGGYGPVHKGFKLTYDSVLRSLGGAAPGVLDVDVVHCVGHSLGGGVATLLAAHFRDQGKAVKLYTFGSPRVGAMGTHVALQTAIGKGNIFRVAHDLDPITLVGPFPYIHVNPAPADDNYMVIPSPTGQLLSFENHRMERYIDSVGDKDATWDDARLLSRQVDHDDALLSRWLLRDEHNAGWVQFATVRTLSLLFKLFHHALRELSTSLILGLTAVDLLAELVVTGMARARVLGDEIIQLLRHAATWAGIPIRAGADIGVTAISAILRVMLARLAELGAQALTRASGGLHPLPLLLTGAAVLTGTVAL